MTKRAATIIVVFLENESDYTVFTIKNAVL